MYNYYSLKKFNTFNINVYSEKIFIIDKVYYLRKILLFNFKNKIPTLILGKGSNILFVNDFLGVVLINKIKGIKITQNIDYWFLNINSGEVWSDVVLFSIYNGIFGLENLACIPGTIGSAVVNNIGAYGVEIKNFVFYVKILDSFTGIFFFIKNYDCKFFYRYSIFKDFIYNRFIIVKVILRVKKKWEPILKYKDLYNYFNFFNNINIYNIYNRIEYIRSCKLPDTKIFGNIGCIFKNPFICYKKFLELKKKYLCFLNNYIFDFHFSKIKIPAALLIDLCKLKGYTIGDAQIYKKHSLIIINVNNAKSKDIFLLFNFIRKKVFKKFKIWLDLEIKLINFFEIFKYIKNIFN